MKDLAKSFGYIFKGKRKEAGLYQDEIALRSGIDRSYVGRIERGEVNISLEKVYLLAEVIGCSPKDLLP
ncbi:helix-turn-helix domain-containing protein [Shewanella sp.]|uniref:helix-turn-helix domain-containing protein n=1 Tax=Shewanella sp. TaxID=50422 RepID=UPI004053B5CB